jgi:pyrroloquinoline quinone biosynthesis protein B
MNFLTTPKNYRFVVFLAFQILKSHFFMKSLLKIGLLFTICGFINCHTNPLHTPSNKNTPSQYVVVLGIAQDAGYPQAACEKSCCREAWADKAKRKTVSCIGLVDKTAAKKWIFDATPDFKDQIQRLQAFAGGNALPNGIFLTHAHIGHYTGLMQLGREVLGAKEMPVFTMPKMKDFLTQNGPWGQLVTLKNIEIQALAQETAIELAKDLKVTPFLVPHRDEYSETVGYQIQGTKKKLIFIPDIDKWQKWKTDLIATLKSVDYALIDGTFLKNGEIKGRDMSEIPHPFVAETIDLLKNLPLSERKKVIFIHFNHTNPLLFSEKAREEVVKMGFSVAFEGQVLEL